VSFYTANLAAFLTVERMESSFETLMDLLLMDQQQLSLGFVSAYAIIATLKFI
jgi:hypothetical protein